MCDEPETSMPPEAANIEPAKVLPDPAILMARFDPEPERS